METVPVDIAIIGGGIVGLNLAYVLKNKYLDCEIAVLEKEPYVGEHSSGRNSGVIHAGLYYPHGSLKHLLCLEGKKLWQELARDLDIGIENCGKFIFSSTSNEDKNLNDLYQKAIKNDVPIKWANKQEMAALTSHVNAHNAIYSPSTSILNVSEALIKLKYYLESKGVNIFLSHQIQTIRKDQSGFILELNDFEIKAEKVFNCAGLGAVSIREQLGLDELENYFVRGHYLSTSQKLNYPTLFYPIPPSDLKGLGVHSTIDLEGKVKFGPNTEEINSIDYTPPAEPLNEMKDLVLHYFKGIEKDKLYWDYAGCRSKIRFKSNKEIHTDFWIKSPIENYVECLGIESPGVTASPAIAKYITNHFLQ